MIKTRKYFVSEAAATAVLEAKGYTFDASLYFPWVKGQSFASIRYNANGYFIQYAG